MNELKDLMDKIDIPKPNLQPLKILQIAMEEKRRKRAFEARLFLLIQVFVISVLVLVAYVSIDFFIYIQLPFLAFGILKVLSSWKRGAKSNG